MLKPALKVVIVVFVLLIAGGLFIVTYYPKFAQNILIPEIEEVKSVNIRLKGDSLFADLALRMHNKGLFKINIDSIDYKISFDTLHVLTKAQDLDIVLKPGDADTFHLPVALHVKRFATRIKELQERDSADIKSDVRMVYNTIFGHASVTHNKTKRIGMLRPPVIEVGKIEYLGRDKKVLRLLVNLTVTNRSPRLVQIKNLSYRIKVSDLFVAEGRVNKTINAVPHVPVHQALPVEVELKRPLKTAYLMLTDQDLLPYDLDVSLLFSASESVDETYITVTKSGKMELKK